MSRVRVLVVDDSPTMRGIISAVLRSDPEIDVVATASDAYAARDAMVEHEPDVVTLDFEMPGMDGLSFLQRIMERRPTPVIMISSAANKNGADLAIAALSHGAAECIPKPGPEEGLTGFEELAELVKSAANSGNNRRGQKRSLSRAQKDYRPGNRIVAIGASTGGVEALTTVLSGFPENCPPTVIVQHMPPNFTKSFSERLNSLCNPVVSEAQDGDVLKQGHVYLAPGGDTHLMVRGRETLKCKLVQTQKVSGHRPSVDVLFRSVAEAVDARGIGVILTGMGADGAVGLLEIRERGGMTFGQNKSSCVIYGMPRVAQEIGAVQRQFPLVRMSEEILRASSANGVDKHAG